jgi:cysteine-rich repeat protein
MNDVEFLSRWVLAASALGLAVFACSADTARIGSNQDIDGGGEGGSAGASLSGGTRCGNAVVEPGEDCDDGNENALDGCRSNCTLSRCGDGFRDVGEDCDYGHVDDGDYCTHECVWQDACGDAVAQAGEECDDGNADDTDACTTRCIAARCGDGIVQSGESCDRGSQNSNGGGCLLTCQEAACGDGFVFEDVEECDEGEDNGDDAAQCTSACELVRP